MKGAKKRARWNYDRANELSGTYHQLLDLGRELRNPAIEAAAPGLKTRFESLLGEMERSVYGETGLRNGIYPYAVDNAKTHGVEHYQMPESWNLLPTFKA